MAYLATHEGYLVVIDDWETSWNQPERYRHYWPTGVPEKELYDPTILGHPVTYKDGSYYLNWKGWWPVHLKDGGDTLPCYTETEPIPKPRGKTWANAVWSRGEWRR